MSLEEQFRIELENQRLISREDSLLLAVSGGIDSMVMLSLFHHLGRTMQVAHCNFQLRGADSDADEQLVRSYCKVHQIQFHSIRFDTLQTAEILQKGIQETARELRYSWLKDLASELKCNRIATAHNANDLAETILFHLFRGTGIKGLTGIPSANDAVFRPLLKFERSQIESYAEFMKVPYREDQSNSKEVYSRNFIRHQILPKVLKLNPSFIQTINEFKSLMTYTFTRYQNNLEQVRENIELVDTDGTILLNCNKLLAEPFPVFTLYDLVNQYGFNENQCMDIITCMREKSIGAKFIGSRFVLVVERECIRICNEDISFDPIKITKLPFSLAHQDQLICIEYVSVANVSFRSGCLFLALDDFEFPLQLRPILPGDRFIPFGMNHSKKVNDYLSDKKIESYQKQKTLVLCKDEFILALIPYEINNKVRIEPHSKRMISVSIKKQAVQ